MSTHRIPRDPSLGTVVVHFLCILVLGATFLPLILLRSIFAPVTEALIRATDHLGDLLQARLDL